MLSAFSYYEEVPPERIKLSRMHRRIFPLSLFPTNNINSLQSTFTPHKTVHKSHFSQKKAKKSQTNPDSVAKPRTQSTIVPRIDYKSVKEAVPQLDSSPNRYFYQPCSLKISPRSKITVYSTSPLGPQPERKEKKRVKTKGKCISELFFDEPKQPFKLSRITSSKITFPSANIGQIMIKVKDLVLDPLKQEIAAYNKKYK